MASDKEIENWLNDHQGTVPAPQPTQKAPADAEIEAWLNDKGQAPPVQGAPQSGLDRVMAAVKSVAPSVGQALAPNLSEMSTGGASSAPDMAGRISNFVQGQPNPQGTTPLTMASNRPDIVAQVGASSIPGVGLVPSALRVAGSVATTKLNPAASNAQAGFAGGLQTLLEALPYGASKMAPAIKAIMSKASGVEASNIAKLFDNPSLLFTGPNKEEAQALYASTANKLGLSPEVSDEVTFGMGKRFLKSVVNDLNAGEDIPTQTLLDARKASDDLIEAAKRRGENAMVKGLVQRRDMLQAQLTAQAPELRAADKAFSSAATRDDFMALLPKNQNGTPSIGKTVIGGLAGGLPAVGMSPIVQGAATSAAGAVAQTGLAIPTGLQAIRQYLISRVRGKV